VAGSCEHGNEISGSMKFWEILELVRKLKAEKEHLVKGPRSCLDTTTDWPTGVYHNITLTV
jgi:hypothetical protein